MSRRRSSSRDLALIATFTGVVAALGLVPVFLPIVLIMANSFVVDLVEADNAFGKVLEFVGAPMIALFLGCLAALPVDGEPRTLDLACARGCGPWTTFARLRLRESPSTDAPSFDPVLNRLPGLDYYDWATRLRERAYRGARRSRDQG